MFPTGRTSTLLAALPLVLLGTTACSGPGEPVAIDPSGARVPSQSDGPSEGGATGSPAATESREDGGPLLGLPPCQAPPEAMADVDVEGLDWPEGAIVTNVQPGDPLVTVTGYIATTPVGVRQYYQGRSDLEIMIEDEIFEAEACSTTGHTATTSRPRRSAGRARSCSVWSLRCGRRGLAGPAGAARRLPKAERPAVDPGWWGSGTDSGTGSPPPRG